MTGPMTLVILKGPSRLGLILLWWLIFRFLISNHTLSPSLNRVNVDLHQSAILFQASSCAAKASSQFLISVLILSSTVGNLVFSNENGIAIGMSLNINSNGAFCLLACLRLLWVNSRVASASRHSSGCEVQ